MGVEISHVKLAWLIGEIDSIELSHELDSQSVHRYQDVVYLHVRGQRIELLRIAQTNALYAQSIFRDRIREELQAQLEEL